MDDLAHPKEVELKFELDRAAARKLRRHALLAKADRRKWSQRTIYFDTDKGKLREKGYTLRVRQIGDRYVQTVKTNAKSAGLFEREEWECPVCRMEPDLSALETTPLADIKNFDRLVPVAQVDVKRTSWTVNRDGSTLEVVLDSGKLRAGDRKAPLRELEIELKKGKASAIFEIAQELSKAAPMEVAMLSKDERGLLLANHDANRGRKASSVDISKKMEVRLAVEMLVQECVRHFRANEPNIVDRRDPEAVHQARVAIRRLRSLFSFFRPSIRQSTVDPLLEELRDFTIPFGKARNLDVFLDHHGSRLCPADRRKLSHAREEAYDRLIETIGDQRTRDLFLRLIEWAATGDWAKREANRPIAKFARAQFDATWKRIRRKGAMIQNLEEKQLHRLRIKIKKLRYALEFMAALYPKKETAKFIRSLEKVQDCLGLVHDDIIARQLIDDYALEFRTGSRDEDQSRRFRESKAQLKRLKKRGPVWSH